MAEIKCTKCGAPIKFEPGDKFVKCSYCDTQLFIDKSGAGFFYIMPFLVEKAGADGIFKRWAAGSKMAKDLDRLARVTELKQVYFPVYFFRRDIGGQEKVVIQPGRSTMLPGLHSLKLPAGDMKVFDQNYRTEVELLKPDVDMAAYLPALAGTAKEQALLYFPLWLLQYDINGRQYGIVIDGSSGEVFVSDFPARKGAPYLLIAAGAFFIFLVEGLLGLILALFLSFIGWLIAVPLVLLTLPFVFAGAYFVVRRY